MENKKPYKCGLIVGRFQIFHNGHKQMIEKALEMCEKVFVFIGSAQESNTSKNPFSYKIRKSFILDVFNQEILDNRIVVKPLKDIGVGNCSSWGDYVIDTAILEFGVCPDLLISGKESRREFWFDNENKSISELYIPKSIEVSASLIRESIISKKDDLWKHFTPSNLWSEYYKLRNELIMSQKNNKTDSV